MKASSQQIGQSQKVKVLANFDATKGRFGL